MRSIPNLNSLRAFEAAARQQSFTAAGDELGVSPAAISRLVKLLEGRLGVMLFERSANRLTLTASGRLYRNGLSPVFDELERLTSQVKDRAQSTILTVGVGPTFATRWLIPRLPEFQVLAPATELRFATGGAAGPFRNDWTCGIELRDGLPDGRKADHLFSADLLPVCSPSMTPDCNRPDVLPPELLLRVAHAPDDWPRWFAANDLPEVEARGPEFEFYGQAIQAAIDGVGIAMGLRPYINDDLSAGRLIDPFGTAISKHKGWYLVYREEVADDDSFATFRTWLMEMAGKSVRDA